MSEPRYSCGRGSEHTWYIEGTLSSLLNYSKFATPETPTDDDGKEQQSGKS